MRLCIHLYPSTGFPTVIKARIGTSKSTGTHDGGNPLERVDLVYLYFVPPWILLALGLGRRVWTQRYGLFA